MKGGVRVSGHARWVTVCQAIAIYLVAFVPRALTVYHPSTDEPLWMQRSEHYIHSYLALDLPAVTSSTTGSPTMPGVTTSLVGGLAHLLWEGLADVGAIAQPQVAWVESRSGLAIAEFAMAAVNALLIVVLWWVLTVWASKIVATTAAVLLATEPYLVAAGIRLNTDSFVMLFGAIGCFALLAALGVGCDPLERRRARLMAAAAGLGLGGAVATKLSALTLGPFVLLVVAIAILRARRDGTLGELGRKVAITSGAGLLFLAVIWPAAWADPAGQLAVVQNSAGLITHPTPRFFLGERTSHPGPLFYEVVVPFRMTPWMLLLTLAGLVGALALRATRRRALLVVAYAAVPWIVISLGSKMYDRYSLLVWPAFAVLIGLLVERAVHVMRQRSPERARLWLGPAGAGAIVGLVVYSLLVVPYGGAYANPLLGGGPVAQDVMELGGFAVAEAGELIRDREGPRCDQRRIASRRPHRYLFPCGQLKPLGDLDTLEPGDYVVVDETLLSRYPGKERELEELGDVVADIRRRGVDVATVYQVH